MLMLYTLFVTRLVTTTLYTNVDGECHYEEEES